MVEVQKSPFNRILNFGIFLSVLWFLAVAYHFTAEVENRKNQSISLANKACIERINVKKSELIKFCEKEISSEDKKLCAAHNEGKLLELEQICPREIGVLKAKSRTPESQVMPFFKAALSTILLWIVGFVFLKIYLKFTKKSDHS